MKILTLLVIWMESPWRQFIDRVLWLTITGVTGIFWKLSGIAQQAALTRVEHEDDSGDRQQKTVCMEPIPLHG